MPLSKCTICGTETDQRCGNCKSAYYCSLTCQKLDRPLHALLCQKLVDFLRNHPRPIADDSESENTAPTYKLAILLPVASPDAEFIWVKINGAMGIWSAVVEYLDRSSDTMTTLKHGRYVDITMGGNCMGDPANAVWMKLNAGYGMDEGCLYGRSIPHRGNLILTSRKGEFSCAAYEDITLADFRYAVNRLTRYHNIYEAIIVNKFILRESGAWSKGVRSMCERDSHLYRNKQSALQDIYLKHVALDKNQSDDKLRYFTALPEGNSAHPVFNDGRVSSISQQMGMKLRVSTLSAHLDGKSGCSGNAYFDDLMTEADPAGAMWGQRLWRKAYTAIFARENKTDFSVCHLEALSAFCITKLIPAMEEVQANTDANVEERKEVVTNFMQSSSKFDEFFEICRIAQKSKKNSVWETLKVPVRDVVSRLVPGGTD